MLNLYYRYCACGFIIAFAEDQYILSEDGWILHNEKEYYFSREKMFMEQAREFCKKNHGDLLVIENESENKFLWKYVRSCFIIFKKHHSVQP